MKISNGVYKYVFGQPETVNADTFRYKAPKLDKLAELSDLPEPFGKDGENIRSYTTRRGFTLEIPMDMKEEIYGFGLQMKCISSNQQKKFLRTNADPVANTGDSHAPVPFYVSTFDRETSYGLLVNTVGYTHFYCGGSKRLRKNADKTIAKQDQIEINSHFSESSILIELEHAQGAEVILFRGETVEEVCRKYILYSGGGCMPPLYGLGNWYRMFMTFTQDEITESVRKTVDSGVPISVVGLEPGWHTHAYSCTYDFDTERYPDKDKLISDMAEKGCKVNLWEHCFTHPGSPIYDKLLPYAADFEVWDGLVPDLSLKEARNIFAGWHKETLVDRGISGFKLDECDGSDYTGGWSYPNMTQFPSGLDGEQMHCILPQLYQQTMLGIYDEKNLRTYGEVRAQFTYAAPYPFVLYSDLYDQRDYIKGLVNMGFSGLLFSPEIRHASSKEDLYRRILAGVFSPKLEFNIFYMKNPPWFNYIVDENTEEKPHPDQEEMTEVCTRLINLRMKLLPYLYTAFWHYAQDGIHPFRSLRAEYPEAADYGDCVEGCILGESILVYPLTAEQKTVKIWLPEGRWYDFFTEEVYEGGKQYTLTPAMDEIPVFVAEGTILPMLENTRLDLNKDIMEITPVIYASRGEYAEGEVYEDDGITKDCEKGIFNTYGLFYENDSLEIEKDGSYDGKRIVFNTYRMVGE